MRLIIRKKGKNGLNISRWNILFASFRYFSNKNRIQFPLNGAIFYISSSFIIDLVVARMENTSSPFRVIFRKIIQFFSYLYDYFFDSPKISIFPISLLLLFFYKNQFLLSSWLEILQTSTILFVSTLPSILRITIPPIEF